MAVDALARALAAGKVPVTAYEMAVKAGYTGTEEQFAQDMGNSGTNAANAAASASAAAASAESVSASAAQIATNTSDISDLKTHLDGGTFTFTKTYMSNNKYSSNRIYNAEDSNIGKNLSQIYNAGTTNAFAYMLDVTLSKTVAFPVGDSISTTQYGCLAFDENDICVWVYRNLSGHSAGDVVTVTLPENSVKMLLVFNNSLNSLDTEYVVTLVTKNALTTLGEASRITDKLGEENAITESFAGSDFVYGSISNSTGLPDTSKHAIHTNYIPVDTGEKVVFTNSDTNIARMIAVYDMSKTFVKYIGDRNSTATSTTILDTVGYVCLILGTKDYTTIAKTDFDTLAQKITITSSRANAILPICYDVQKSLSVTDKLSIDALTENYPGSVYTYGSVSNGVPDTSKHAIHTDLISTDSGEKVVFTNTDTNIALMICIYDSSKTYVKQIGTRDSTSSKTTTIDTAGFIRLILATKDYTTIATSSFDTLAQKVVITSSRADAIYPMFFNMKEMNSKLSEIYPKVASYPETYNYDTKTEAFDALFKESGASDAFIFFTDPHLLSEGDKSAFYDRFMNYTGVIGGFFDRLATSFVLCAGDWLEWNDTPNLALYKLNLMTGRMRELFGDHYYPALGNHDSNEQGTEVDGVKTLSDSTLRNVMFPYQSALYYSFKTVNARYYVLNTGTDHNTGMSYGDRWEQIAWLAAQLAENDDSHSAICMHILWNDTSAQSIATFADNVQTLVGAYNAQSTVELNNVTYDFTSCTGKVGFIIGGHLHQDKSDTTNYSVPVIASTNVRNNGSYPSFDLVLVDWSENEMNMVRVGNGSDRTFTLA